MADLRLVGVHDDGRHLLLSGPDGEIYLLPLDEALRTAVGKNSQRSSRTAQTPGTRMSPREIQALIRAGATASDVAEQSGLSLEQVRRYEGPVLAERDYIASQARKVEVASPSAHNDGFKSAFGEEAATLDDMVRHRLAVFGIDPKSLRWDAWRENAGAWTVSADFEPGQEWAANSIGEAAPALWRFHAARKSLHNANRWAQQLSELEPLDSPLAERRLSAVVDKPFDVEAESADAVGDTDGEDATTEIDAAASETSPHGGLLDMLRSRRGMRLGLDEEGDDELAAMLGTHVPGAHPRDEALYTPQPEQADAEEAGVSADASAKEKLRAIPFLQLAPRLAEAEHPLASVDSVAEVSTETREVVLSGEPGASLRPTHTQAEPVIELAPRPSSNPVRDGVETAVDGPSDSEVAARLERKAAGKPKRSSVPSWDEIVFGTKGD